VKMQPTIVVDSREKCAWLFENLPTERAALDTGDYSIRGLTHLVAVERKSLPDLLACVGAQRGRFKRELQRLRGYRFRCLVIEASYSDLEAGEWRSKIKPSAVLGSLAAWTVQCSLPVMLAGDHESAARFAERYLYQCARLVASENAAIGMEAECVA